MGQAVRRNVGMIDSCLGYSLLSEYTLMPLKKSRIYEKTVITLLYYAIVKALLLVYSSLINGFGLVLAYCANPTNCYLRDWGKEATVR